MSQNTNKKLVLQELFQEQKSKVHPIWMGILNVTPDSFSDGGQYRSSCQAAKQVDHLFRHGAKVIDVGAVSTRPGSSPPDEAEELERLLPTLEAIRIKYGENLVVSLDSSTPSVVLECVKRDLIDLVNDVHACQVTDRNLGATTATICAEYSLPLILMHMQGSPKNMQNSPYYDNCIQEVTEFLKSRVHYAQSCGVKNLIADPGIGFGKRLEDNLALLSEKGLKNLKTLSVPIMIGLSRKRFLASLSGLPNPMIDSCERDFITKENEYRAIEFGADIIRSHRMPSELDADFPIPCT